MAYKTNPIEFLKQVKAEMKKIVWPSRREVSVSVVVVLVMVTVSSSFFFSTDQFIGWAMRFILNVGN